MTVLSLCVCCALRPTPFDATRRLGCVTSTRTGASFCLEFLACFLKKFGGSFDFFTCNLAQCELGN